jgi:hypothetical protein
MPVFNLEDMRSMLVDEDEHGWPYYEVLLYSPLNGIEAQLHDYVRKQWSFLNALTGSNALLVALEDIDRSIEDFKAEDVYEIARYLGAGVDDLPCIVFFTEPLKRNDTVILRLGEFLPDSDELRDEDLTALFRRLEAIMDGCVVGRRSDLDCLRKGLEHQWPTESRWRLRTTQARGAVVSAAALGVSVAEGLDGVVKVINTLGLGH